MGKIEGPPDDVELLIRDPAIPFCWYRHEVHQNVRIEGAPHKHAKFQIVAVEHGVLTLLTSRGHLLVPPGGGIWIPAHLEHGAYYHGQTTSLNLYIEASFLQQTFPGEVSFVTFTDLFSLVLRKILLLPLNERDNTNTLNLMRVLLDELHFSEERVIRVPWPDDPRLQKICTLLDTDPTETREFDQLAPLAGASPRNLSRLFSRELGMSYTEWRSLLRISKAVQCLATGVPITEVALACGFQTLSSFNKRFKELTGKSPSKYQRGFKLNS